MATKRAILVEDPDEVELQDQQQKEFDAADEDTDGELFRAVEEMRGTAGVMLLLTRIYPTTPDQFGYVGQMTPEEFTLDQVREVYGPGKYKVRVKGPKGFLKGGGTVHVARGAVRPPPSGGGGSAPSDVLALLKAMQDQETARRMEGAQRRDRWIELAIPGLLTVVATLLGKNTGPDMTALITALKPAPGPTMADLTAALSNLKNLSEPKSDGSQLEMVLKVLDVAKEHLGGGEKGESNWIDVLRDVLKEGLPAVKPLLENMQAARAPIQATVVRPASGPFALPVTPSASTASPSSSDVAASVSTPATQSSPPAADGPSDMLALFLPIAKQQAEKLLAWAVKAARVELYAEVLLEELPTIIHQYLTPEKALGYLKDARWFEVVCNVEPRLREHQAWLDALRAEVIDIIEEQIRDETRKQAGPQIVDDAGETTE